MMGTVNSIAPETKLVKGMIPLIVVGMLWVMVLLKSCVLNLMEK